MFTVCPNCQKSFPVPGAGKFPCPNCKSMINIPPPGSGKPPQVIAVSDPSRMRAHLRNVVDGQERSREESRRLRMRTDPGSRQREDTYKRRPVPANDWERPSRRRETFVQRYLNTWFRIVAHPREAFQDALGKKVTMRRSLVFAWVTLSLGVTINLLIMLMLVYLSQSALTEVRMALEQTQRTVPSWIPALIETPRITILSWILVLVLLTPLVMLSWAALVSFVIQKTGTNLPAWQKTAPMILYATAPLLITAVPIAGPIVAVPMWLYSTRSAFLFYQGRGWRLENAVSVAFNILAVSIAVAASLLHRLLT